MSFKFYNPYQFVQVDTRQTVLSSYHDRDALKNRANEYVRHDYWHSGGYSGRIQCTLEALSPLVVGAGQTAGNRNKTSGIVAPYLDNDGNPAIPGSSLRGMIGSVLETISQSAMRVLASEKNGAYSVRKPARQANEEALTDIGLVCRTNGKCFILPLPARTGILSQARGEYYPERDGSNAELAKFNDEINGANCYQHIHDNHSKTYGGIYFIRGKMQGMPIKRREHFFKITDIDLENTSKMLPVTEDAVRTMENILRIRYEEEAKNCDPVKMQLLPKGYMNHPRDWNIGSDQHLLLHGDLVYYNSSNKDYIQETVVEVSYSAIWRKQVPGDLHHAFSVHAGPNALPWNASREGLTPAEALLGVVENEPQSDAAARNLASRVRVSDALAYKNVKLENECTLKALSKPKPPCPAMYFGDANGYVAKTELKLDGNEPNSPNGRKHYVPHTRSIGYDHESKWTTTDELTRPHLKLKCQPIAQKSQFRFTVSFENLSDAEFTLLHRSIKPKGNENTYIHRLGLGKPIGLGHVTIKETQIDLIDRFTRYNVNSVIEKLPRYKRKEPFENDALINASAVSQLIAISDLHTSEIRDVCYPFTKEQGHPYFEVDGYKWFSQNDKDGKDSKDSKDIVRQALNRPRHDDAMKPIGSN